MTRRFNVNILLKLIHYFYFLEDFCGKLLCTDL